MNEMLTLPPLSLAFCRTVSYMLLRFMIRFVNAQLAKHSGCRRTGFKYSGFRNGFTLRGALLH